MTEGAEEVSLHLPLTCPQDLLCTSPEMDMPLPWKSFSPALPTTLCSSQMHALAVPLYMLTLCGLRAFPTLFPLRIVCFLSVIQGPCHPPVFLKPRRGNSIALLQGMWRWRCNKAIDLRVELQSSHRSFWRRKIEVALTYNWIRAFGLSLRLLEPTIKWSLKSHVVYISEHKTPASSM